MYLFKLYLFNCSNDHASHFCEVFYFSIDSAQLIVSTPKQILIEMAKALKCNSHPIFVKKGGCLSNAQSL